MTHIDDKWLLKVAEDVGQVKAHVTRLKEGQDELLTEARRSNGRISSLERWQSRVLGAGFVGALAMTPLLVQEVRNAIATLMQGG